MAVMREIVPVGQAARRLPEAGRIRLGVQVPNKSGKGTHPEGIKTLRFTSASRIYIDNIAEKYGGTPKPWQRDEHEVITDAVEVPVVLPPDPLGGTPVYEEWSKGGLVRRCDGIMCSEPCKTPDGVEMIEVACRCQAAQALACKVVTRLSVLLTDIPFGGTWRVESHGWGAFHELPGMVEMIQRLQSSGLVRAYLGVRAEDKAVMGQTQNWVEPYLRMDESVAEIVAGAARLQALGQAEERPALPSAPDVPVEAPTDDDTPAEGEFVGGAGEWEDDAPPDTEPADVVGEEPTTSEAEEHRVRRVRVVMLSREVTDDEEKARSLRHALALTISDGATENVTDLDLAQLARAVGALERIRKNEVVPQIDAAGGLTLLKPR